MFLVQISMALEIVATMAPFPSLCHYRGGGSLKVPVATQAGRIWGASGPGTLGLHFRLSNLYLSYRLLELINPIPLASSDPMPLPSPLPGHHDHGHHLLRPPLCQPLCQALYISVTHSQLAFSLTPGSVQCHIPNDISLPSKKNWKLSENFILFSTKISGVSLSR